MFRSVVYLSKTPQIVSCLGAHLLTDSDGAGGPLGRSSEGSILINKKTVDVEFWLPVKAVHVHPLYGGAKR